MRRKLDDQRDFVELFWPEEVGRDAVLERADGLVDWGALEAVCGDIYATPVGRPSYPLGVPSKALLVQAWWNLSDAKAEQLLGNDLRFRRFPGVGLSGKTPDRNTLWRFGDELSKRGLAETLLAEVDRQLRARGVVMRRGAIVAATLIASAASPTNRRRDGEPVDADADWTRREKREPTLGYELHAAVEEDSGIVRRIAHNPRRRGLARWQKGVNFVVRTVRPRIEPVFGTLKRSYGLARARCFPLARNAADATMKALAWNLRRALTLPEHAT